MYTEVVPRPADLRPRHSVENQWDLLAHLGRPLPAGARPGPPPRPDGRIRRGRGRRSQRRLADAGVGPAHRLVVVHVSAGNPFRRWPAGHFVELAVQLAANDPDRRIILTSGPSEAEAARAIVEHARRAARCRIGDRIRTGDEYSLAELRSLVARAAVYVGGDSGPLHVAATSDVPIVGLYGPTLPVRSAPWRPAGDTEPGPSSGSTWPAGRATSVGA